MRFFRSRNSKQRQDGRSSETAFILPPSGRAVIPLEYEIVSKMFGKEGHAWRLELRGHE